MAGDQRLIKINADLELATDLAKIELGRLPKWPTGTDCKSVGRRLRRFESFTAHLSQTADRCPCTPVSAVDEWQKALIAQSVEHVLGKNGVMGSNPIEGSRCQARNKCFGRRRNRMGKQKFERNKAAHERGDDGTHRPREDDLDGGDHQILRHAGDGRIPTVRIRSTMRRKRKRAGSRST